MNTIVIKNKTVTITPEYFTSKFKSLEKLAKKTPGIFIGSYSSPRYVSIAVFNNGEYLGNRHKFRPTKSEINNGRRRGDEPPKVFEVDGLRILPIICYELLYPKDYVHNQNVDLVTHHSYFSMFDLAQYEGWKAMYHTLSVLFNCPVICDNFDENPMSTKGIVYPKDESEDFLNKKFDHWRKI